MDAALRFYAQARDAMETLARWPSLGTLRVVSKPALQGLRSWPITGYRNYLIFYLPLPGGGIDVLHVLHGARDVERIIERG